MTGTDGERERRKMFVNLPVADLKRSMDFFGKLGFEFNPQFTDDKAACMVIGEDAFVMLLTEPFFGTFTKRAICDTSRSTEGLFALTCEGRDRVDALFEIAVTAGGKSAMEPVDHGFMYGRSFYDPDGHHWELFWMDPAAASGQTEEAS